MKQDLSYLPVNKQHELNLLSQLICELATPEMVILFGSYARGDWVEDKYDESHYRYQSDFDILVIVQTRSKTTQAKLECDIEEQLDQQPAITTPVSVIVHDMEYVNQWLSKAQYFFSDIKKEGVLLYDSGKFQLSAPKELLPAERQRLAQEDFAYYFEKADNLREGFAFYFNKEKLNEAAFLLHQTTQRLYSGILLVFTRYKPNTHDLAVLRKLVNSINNQFSAIFPLNTAENRRLFKLLRKAYVDARYKPSYKITQEQLAVLIKQVDALQELGKTLCLEAIANFMAAA